VSGSVSRRLVLARIGMRCRMVIFSGPIRIVFTEQPQYMLEIGHGGGGEALDTACGLYRNDPTAWT
jgi:hypothetical protein